MKASSFVVLFFFSITYMNNSVTAYPCQYCYMRPAENLTKTPIRPNYKQFTFGNLFSCAHVSGSFCLSCMRRIVLYGGNTCPLCKKSPQPITQSQTSSSGIADLFAADEQIIPVLGKALLVQHSRNRNASIHEIN